MRVGGERSNRVMIVAVLAVLHETGDNSGVCVGFKLIAAAVGALRGHAAAVPGQPPPPVPGFTDAVDTVGDVYPAGHDPRGPFRLAAGQGGGQFRDAGERGTDVAG